MVDVPMVEAEARCADMDARCSTPTNHCCFCVLGKALRTFSPCREGDGFVAPILLLPCRCLWSTAWLCCGAGAAARPVARPGEVAPHGALPEEAQKHHHYRYGLMDSHSGACNRRGAGLRGERVVAACASSPQGTRWTSSMASPTAQASTWCSGSTPCCGGTARSGTAPMPGSCWATAPSAATTSPGSWATVSAATSAPWARTGPEASPGADGRVLTRAQQLQEEVRHLHRRLPAGPGFHPPAPAAEPAPPVPACQALRP